MAGTSVQEVAAASRAVEPGSVLVCRAQRLAGMLHKLHFPEAETEADLLADVIEAAPSPAVALLLLITTALDTRGVPAQQRLAPIAPLLDAHLAAAAAAASDEPTPQQQQQQQQQQPAPLISQDQLSTALLAAVQLLPDLQEDLPSAPCQLAQLIGHCVAAGQVDFGLRELAAAVCQAGTETPPPVSGRAAAGGAGGVAAAGESCGSLGGEEEGGEEEDPPLVASDAAGPMLLLVANAIKEVSGEAAAQAAWSAAAIDLASLLPSYANGPADVDHLLQRYDATYLAKAV